VLYVASAPLRVGNGVASVLLPFIVDYPRKPDDPPNSSKDNRYPSRLRVGLTVVSTSWPSAIKKSISHSTEKLPERLRHGGANLICSHGVGPLYN
jgi:hypothetical protein